MIERQPPGATPSLTVGRPLSLLGGRGRKGEPRRRAEGDEDVGVAVRAVAEPEVEPAGPRPEAQGAGAGARAAGIVRPEIGYMDRPLQRGGGCAQGRRGVRSASDRPASLYAVATLEHLSCVGVVFLFHVHKEL